MAVYNPAATPVNRAGAWVEQLILNVSDNVLFALFGGAGGYMVGHLLLRITHAIAGYVADGLGVDYALRAQIWVYYLTLWGSAACFAYLGVNFALISKRRPEPEETEFEAETQVWGEPLEPASKEEPVYRLARKYR